MAKLKPWYHAITPREDLRENRPLDASEFAVHLDHIRAGNAHPDYLDPARFFQRTYLTESLLGLAAQVMRRLSGIQVETSAAYNMSTQFGGGKSHALTTLYHLAEHGEAAKGWRGVDRILERAGIPTVPRAATAVFMGKQFDALNGRGGGDEPKRYTPWGDIAWQLGGAESFAAVARHDEERIEPKGDAILAMLPKDRPSLILMDEIISYVSTYRRMGYGSALYNFIDCLGETARGEKNVVLVVSVPASELEYTAEDAADEQRFKKMLDRIGKAVIMSADNDISEIIRRRLFEWTEFPAEAKQVVRAYGDWASQHAQELVGVSPDTIYDQLMTCYPFHPTLLSVFQRKWQSVPRFQRTRGMLRLLAYWVAWSYQKDHRDAADEPFITLGLAPLEDPNFRSALFEQLGSDKLEIPVTTDIAGKGDAHSLRLDREASEEVRKARMHRKVATAIFFESNGGMTGSKDSATIPEIRTAVGGPAVNLAELDTVLEGLVGTCYYLNWDHQRYRFGMQPNLNQILVTRRGDVRAKDLEERIREVTETVFGRGAKGIDRWYWWRGDRVPDRPVVTFVVLGRDYPAGERGTQALIDATIRNAGSKGRTYKSSLFFAAPDAGNTIETAARELLAWEAIKEDTDTFSRLDDSQKNVLRASLKRAERDLEDAIVRAYHLLFLLGKDNQVLEHELGQITAGMCDAGLVPLYLDFLQNKKGDVTDSVSTRMLVKYWISSAAEWSTKGVWDAFYSSPLLPRLLTASAVQRAIADGVTSGELAYASRNAEGNLRLIKFGESLSEAEVEISDDVFLLRKEDAQKLKEPPRLTRLSIQPGTCDLKPGEKQAFRCTGFDQYGQAFELPPVTWSGSGGAIAADGLFTAGAEEGGFAIQAAVEGIATVADVRIRKESRRPEPETPNERLVSWSGSVPQQKWMNFYTKVLSRLASLPGLELEVSFRIRLPAEGADAKAADARSGLKELGLDGDVNVR